MKTMLKAVAGIGAVLVLLVAAAVVLPFVIDFNRFKPQIQAAVSENLNAQVDFESARLTILTGLGVRLQKVSVTNTDPVFKGTRLFYVDELDFRTELAPLLEKKFVGHVEIARPEIVVARKGLQSNIGALAKPDAAEGGSDAPNDPQKPKTPEEREKQRQQIEQFKKNVVIKALEIRNASVTVREFTPTGTKEPVKISDLKILVSNIGVERDVKVDVSTQTAFNQDGIRVQGPIQFDLSTRVNVDGPQWKTASFRGRLDLDKLNVNARNAYVKTPESPLNVNFEGAVTPSTFDLAKLNLRLHNIDVAAQAKINDFKRLVTDASVKVDSKDLQKLGAVLPQHKNLLVNASLDLDASLKGELSKPMGVASNLQLRTNLSGSDLNVQWASKRLEPIQANINVASKRLDLGAIVKPFLPPEGAGKTADAGGTPVEEAKGGQGGNKRSPSGAGATETPAQEFALTPEQKKLLENADINAKVSIGEFLYDKIKLDNLIVDAAVQGLAINLRQFALAGFGGNVKADGLVNLSSAPVSFRTALDLQNVRVEQLVAFVKPEHKDVLEGAANLELKLDGRGTTMPTLSKTLNGTGRFAFEDGELKTQSVVALAQEKFDGFVGGLSVVAVADSAFKNAEKILENPLVKQAGGAKNFDLAKIKAEYETIKNVKISDKLNADRKLKGVDGKLEIKQGRIGITSTKKSVDGAFALDGSVGLDLTLGGNALYTASDKVREKMLQQSKHANLLFDEKNNLNLAMLLGGTVTRPDVKIDFSALEKQFKANAQALVEREVRKQADDLVNKLLKGKADAALAELKKKQEELKAKLDGERKKAQEQAKAKEAEAKAKAKAEVDKALQKNKGKLQGLFGK